jgi:hypothetical protein
MMKMIKMLMAVFLFSLAAAAQAEVGVARSAFTTQVQDREPVDQVGQLTNDNGQVYFFTEIQDMNGHTITHRWEQDGEVKAEVSFNIGGDRWRVWSSKTLQSDWLGEWKVSVVDEGGNVLAQESFAYIPAQPAAGKQSETDDMPGDMSAGKQDDMSGAEEITSKGGIGSDEDKPMATDQAADTEQPMAGESTDMNQDEMAPASTGNMQ